MRRARARPARRRPRTKRSTGNFGRRRVAEPVLASTTSPTRRSLHVLRSSSAPRVLHPKALASLLQLYAEESALLETIDGRGPFPRVVPPYRIGLRGDDPYRQLGTGPALVNNVETMANVPQILARGTAWFRSVGTPASPGTVACTVTGDVNGDGDRNTPTP
jgi:hypothetical protein